MFNNFLLLIYDLLREFHDIVIEYVEISLVFVAIFIDYCIWKKISFKKNQSTVLHAKNNTNSRIFAI